MIADIKDMTPTPETIAMLERLLEEAKSGQLRTVVAICGYASDEWTNNWSIDPRNTRRRLVGQFSLMHFYLLTNTAAANRHSELSKVLTEMRS